MHSLLLVEDNPHDLNLALLALAPHSGFYAVTTVRDGEEAIANLRRKGTWKNRHGDDPALILMDLKLPNSTVSTSCKKSVERRQSVCSPLLP
ncbi:response regulator [Caballeronia cordobensis]|uniref:hypothetical protein n=1 Tax=Caballeronia cordobensis TaxID=1353886 RepID=UPI000B33B736|nr:hypothetical protein [Caballeronia cordobensis]